jgi:EmrB/QacA subfamily drug resistance transporter
VPAQHALTEERRRTLTLAACALGSSLAFVDATVVIVALPVIREDLAFGLTGQQWVFLSYSLALAALYLPAGAVGDRWGRREVFVAGALGFAVASALAGAAPNGEILIGARVLQGIAGAFVTTNSLALLRETYGAESGRAVGLWTSLTSISTIVGPPLGGALAEWSWRWIFYVNLPLAALTVVLAQAGRCRSRTQHRVGALDIPGAALAAVGFGALTYGVVEGAEDGFAGYWWAFSLAAASLAAFLVVEWRSREPMLPLGLFRHRNFAAANLETFFVYAALGGLLLFWTLYLQFLGFRPLVAGLLNVPTSLVMIFLAARFGALADRHGPRLYLTVGPLLLGLGMLLFLPLDDRSDFWTAGVAGLALFSLGLALLVAPITSTALASAPGRYAGIASGVNQTVSRVGSLLAVAVIGLVVTLVFEASAGDVGGVPFARGEDDPELRAASVDAFRAAMVAGALLAFAGAAVAAVGISNAEARADREDATAPAPAGS